MDGDLGLHFRRYDVLSPISDPQRLLPQHPISLQSLPVATFVYKGTIFAAVRFAAGLEGTALSNGSIKMRKKMDPAGLFLNAVWFAAGLFLNALSWAIHMDLSSNIRYQTLTGVEFMLAKGLPSLAFKTSVGVSRPMLF